MTAFWFFPKISVKLKFVEDVSNIIITYCHSCQTRFAFFSLSSYSLSLLLLRVCLTECVPE